MDTATVHEMIPTWAEGAPADGEWLFHATSQDCLQGIVKDGLRSVCYLGCLDVAKYYAEVVQDEGRVPVLLAVPKSGLDPHFLEPDEPGIEEPLTYTLGMSEDEVSDAWERSNGGWQDSLDIVRSVRYRAGIPAALIRIFPVPGLTAS